MIKRKKGLWLGILLACFYWLSDSFIDVFILEEYEIVESLFPLSEVRELYMRMIIVLLIIGLGFFADRMNKKLQNAYDKEKELTNKLQQSVDKLEKEIKERRIMEQQLQIRQKMDFIATLAAGIAHDFNNILVGILGYADFLQLDSDNFTESQLDSLQEIIVSCDRAAQLIKKFQKLSQKSDTKKSCIDIFEIAEEVCSLLRKITNKKIKKLILFSRGEFYVHSNASDLNQVFLNIAINAVHAIEEAEKKDGRLAITAEEYTISGSDHHTGLIAGDYIHIIFEDNGTGMSEKVQNNAFSPMFTTKAQGSRKGQGLGLAMVYNIVVKDNNGAVYLESLKGKGTSIHLYLPKSENNQIDVDEKNDEILRGNGVVLVIDDEKVCRHLVKRSLTKYGYKVLIAANGREGLYTYQENEVDIVILDLAMPEMSGKTVLQKILQINPDARVIISSGHGDNILENKDFAQISGCLNKPYKVNELLKIVTQVNPRKIGDHN